MPGVRAAGIAKIADYLLQSNTSVPPVALGAQRGSVVRMVVRQGMTIGLWGIAAGLGGVYGLTRLMGSLLYGVAPNDSGTFAAVAITLASTVALASWVPASKAALVDPLVALRMNDLNGPQRR